MSRFLPFFSKRKKAVPVLLLLLAAGAAAVIGLGVFTPETDRFDKFTREVFRSELSGNTLNMHYTIAAPSSFGLGDYEVTLGNPGVESRKQYYSVLENYLGTLQEFSRERLTDAQQLTYDIFESYLRTELESGNLFLYDEPLSPTLGIQAQLPILLAEYPFRTKKDIEDYLTLLTQIPDYFQAVLSYENTRSANGLFMSDDCAVDVIRQCQEFIADPENNYLAEIFNDKISEISNLTVDEKIAYQNRNSQILLSCVVPSYQRLIDGLTTLIGSGKNPMGLYYYPKGTEYYRYLIKSHVGDSRPVEDIEAAVKKQMVADYAAVQELLKSMQQPEASGAPSETDSPDSSGRPSETDSSDSSGTPSENDSSDSSGRPSGNDSSDSSGAPSGNDSSAFSDAQTAAAIQSAALPAAAAAPEQILSDLRQKITKDFPVLPNVSCNVKYVHDSLQKYLSPAFYLTPAIDDYKNNVIYINPSSNYNALELFTTLAHEGYPGHLYQSVYFSASEPDLLRNILDTSGYTEGWATYVEMYSYGLWEGDPQAAALGQHNRAFMLGLASLLDIGIHYRGYSPDEVKAFLEQLGFDSSTSNALYRSILEAPANYLQYYVGYLNFCELREYAKELMGNQFTLKKYHTMILEAGPAPFDILRTYLEEHARG